MAETPVGEAPAHVYFDVDYMELAAILFGQAAARSAELSRKEGKEKKHRRRWNEEKCGCGRNRGEGWEHASSNTAGRRGGKSGEWKNFHDSGGKGRMRVG